MGPEADETATLVKLIRASMLAPVVLTFSLIIRSQGLADDMDGTRPLLLPSFVIGFPVLVMLNSLRLIPLSEIAAGLSRWCLLVAIAAVGISTSLGKMLAVGPGTVALLVLETMFLGGWVMAGLHVLR